MYLIAKSAVVPLFSHPTLRAEQVSQLVLGETARLLLEASAEWRRVRCELDGYEGWVHTGYVVEVGDAGADAWRRDATGWSQGATVATEEGRVHLPLRARVGIEPAGVRLPDGRLAQAVEGAVVTSTEANAEARRVAPHCWALEHFAGTPYEWGGVTPWGADCSGLVQTTFAARGITLPRDAALQATRGEPVPVDAVRPGDLVFFRSEQGDGITHVAFVGEGDTLVHSTVACGGVLAEPWLPGSRAGVLRERVAVVRRIA